MRTKSQSKLGHRGAIIVVLLGLLGGLLPILVIALPSHAAAAAPIRIMPLGDSITQGDCTCGMSANIATYRYFLWQKLIGAGYNVTFVGSETGVSPEADNPNGVPEYPWFNQSNEGHAGYWIENATDGPLNLEPNVAAWVTAAKPDVILLHAGTNDIRFGTPEATVVSRMSDLIGQIRSAAPSVTIVLAQIIPTSGWDVTQYNAGLATLASQLTTAQSRIVLVNQYTGFDVNADTRDGIHPNQAGEELMAAKWYAALQQILPAPSVPSSPSFALRIHAGGAAYVDSAGNTWLADADFTGGSTNSTSATIAGTSDPALFQSERFGMSAYSIPLPGPGTYTVQIYEAEIYWTSPGKRIFSVTANGTPILTEHDIDAAVGANTAEVLTASVPVTGSTLTLSFTGVVDQAKVAAIAVLGTSSGGTTTTTTTAPTGSFALRIHAGGGSYVDSGGNTWLADTDFTGGSPNSTSATIAGTSDPALFQSERFGMSAYTIPVPGPGTYTVQIYESEIYWTSPGKRIFSVTANGTPILTNYDIYAAVGANTADVVTASVPVTGSTLTLSFSAKVDQAKVAGIVVLGPSSGGTTTTTTTAPTTTTTTAPTGSFALRIHAGGGSYVDSGGNTWLADTDFTGGSPNSTSATIAGTSDPALFQSERFGMSAYTIPVPGPGTYTVQIYESEIYWTSPGKRIFSVTANGTPILTNYDIYAAVGANTADVVTASVPVTGSTLTLSFSAKVDQAKVAGIVVLGPSSGGTTTTTTTAPTTTTTTAPTGSFALRIHAGGGSYVDSGGNTWLADTDFTGGSPNSTSATIAGTSDPALFQSERFGMSAYTIPVPGPGTYTVQIYESEIYWTSPGKRIFSVTANGTPVLTNYDIDAAVGANTADVVTASVPVTGSTLTLSFSAKVDQAKVAGIVVLGP